jgi:uncharacterized protein YraI
LLWGWLGWNLGAISCVSDSEEKGIWIMQKNSKRMYVTSPAFTVLLAAIFLAACGSPGTGTAFPPDMQTAAALTVEALLSATPAFTPTLAVSPTPMVLTVTPNLSTPATPATPAAPARMTVEDITNCRSGPGTDYEQVTQISPGEEVAILGSLPNYWLVQTAEGQCWVAREFATPMGDIARVPTVTAPPTPQGGAVAAPSISEWTYACTGGGRADLNIRWSDRATNEAGYRVYMNGEVIKELPADSKEFSSSVLVPVGLKVQFYVEAFNTSGAASSVVYEFTC